MIDLYCERLGPGLWAEPLNAASNAAFIVAAFMAYMFARQQRQASASTLWLITLLFLIGIGSSLFHTFATRLTLAADVIPILLFQVSYIISYMLMVERARVLTCGLVLLLYVSASAAAGMIDMPQLNGSQSYFPAFLILLLFGLRHLQQGRPGRYLLIAASVLLVASLSFRTLDQAVCPALPIGVHFMWHLLNAVLLYLCIRAYILAQRQPGIPPL